MTPAALIELAFSAWQVPAKYAHHDGNSWGNADISHARYLAFRLLSEYNGLIGSEIGQIFNLGRATVNSGLVKMQQVIDGGTKTWSHNHMRKKYIECVRVIEAMHEPRVAV